MYVLAGTIQIEYKPLLILPLVNMLVFSKIVRKYHYKNGKLADVVKHYVAKIQTKFLLESPPSITSLLWWFRKFSIDASKCLYIYFKLKAENLLPMIGHFVWSDPAR